MEKIFTQEELYWLDDILPGTNIGRIRRTSASRHVQLPKVVDESTTMVTIDRVMFFLFLCLTLFQRYLSMFVIDEEII
jgi:hypothetical protein